MSEADLKKLFALLDECLEFDPAERRDHARKLCPDQPALLTRLLGLIDRDERLDRDQHVSEAGLGTLTRVALSERFFKGQVVGSFRIEECIGTGGMGAVYRVTRIDGQVEQQAALKLLNPGQIKQSLLSRFSNERRVLASMEHPGICRFLDAGEFNDGQPYVLMELIDGQPFFEYCDLQRLNVRQRVELFLKVTAAVAHAHRRLIVHRDIKSGNILVNQEGQPKLLDFGIAKNLALNASWEQTLTVEQFLTPRSAAPEQLLGRPIGVACDIYALGQLLYQILSGRPLFDFSGLRPGEIEKLIVAQPPRPMAQRCLAIDQAGLRNRGCRTHRELQAWMRGDLESIVSNCLRKDPEHRYPSVEQLDADLMRWLANRPIKLRLNERGYRLRKFVARNQLVVTLAMILTVTLLGSSLGLAWQSVNMAKERNRALLERDRAQHAVSILQQAFESADPAGVLGADVRARDILRSARMPVLALRESQPDLFVSLAAVLAQVEFSLLQTESAAQLAGAALDVAHLTDVGRSQIRELLMIKARALTNSRHRPEAAATLEQVASMDEFPQADLLHAQGRWHLLGNERALALELFEQAEALHAHANAPIEVRLKHSLDLATALSQSGYHDRSLRIQDDLLEALEASFGTEHALTNQSRLARIETLIRAEHLVQAAEEAGIVQRQIHRLYGPRSAWAGRLHGTFGMLHLSRSDPASASEHYRQALDIWREHLSFDHPDILRVSINLAFALQHSEGGLDEAEAVYIKSLDLLVSRSGVNNHTALLVRGLLSQLLTSQEKHRAAIEQLIGAEELDVQIAVRVSPWRQGFIQALDSQDCALIGLPDRLQHRCEQVTETLAGLP